MTIHTKAATDDIYDIFNAPLLQNPPNFEESDHEYESDYTTDAESTGAAKTGDDASEHGDDVTSDAKSVSEWSDFSVGKHIPDLGIEDRTVTLNQDAEMSDLIDTSEQTTATETQSGPLGEDVQQLHTPDLQESPPRSRTSFIPIPPEDYDPPTRPFRDPVEVANNRLPFMTPITERTEPNLSLIMDRSFDYKTPCKRDNSHFAAEDHLDLEPLSSPLREIVEEEMPLPKVPETLQPKPAPLLKKPLAAKAIPKKGPIIKDTLCNPLDESVRAEILSSIQPPLSVYRGFFDHRHEKYERGSEIRKYIKALNSKSRQTGGERGGSLPPQVAIELPDVASTYELQRELGAGAFAPVYLVQNSHGDVQDENDENSGAVMGQGTFAVNRRSALEALKMESPPTPWEFYMMRLAHSRIGSQHRVAESMSYAHELHLYQDEGFLFLPYHPHGTLLDVVNHFHSQPSGVMDEQLAMFFAIELMRTVEGLHAKQIIHGDLKADNCLLRLDALINESPLASRWSADGSNGWSSRGVTLIDFGRGIDMKAFVPNVEFFADWKTSDQDCSEMREARPWTWQIDYYGLAGTIHCLLFGKYIETTRYDQGGIGKTGRKYKIRESLKRYWQTDIWSECFEVLLNPASYVEKEEGGSMPVLTSMRAVRERMEGWLEANSEKGVGLKSLIGKLEVYSKGRR